MLSPRNISLLISLSITFAVCKGQQKFADSLEHVLSSTQGKPRVDLLNQLTYEFITKDNDKVVRYNKEAIQLAQKTGYIKAEGIAYAYRGVYEYILGQFARARRDLHTSLRLARQANDKKTEAYAFLQLGVCGLEEVATDSAYLHLHQAYQLLKDSTDAKTLSKLYRNMSSMYGQRFQPDSQQYFLDRAIVIQRLLPDKTLLADALIVQASHKLGTGDIARTKALLNEASVILKGYPEDLENFHDIEHVRALMLFQQGDFEKAIVLFDSARNYYFRSSLFRKYVTMLNDLGKIFADRGDYELALNNYYDALRMSRAKGFQTEMYQIYNRIGWVHFALGDMLEALRLANEALTTGPRTPLREDLAHVLTLKGVVLTEIRRYPEARQCLDQVFKMYESVQNHRGMSETLMNLGALETGLRQYPKALAYYEQSIAHAIKGNYLYGQAWSNWGSGDIFFRLGDYDKADAFLTRSEYFSNLIHANSTLVRNYNTRRDLLAAQGRYRESLHYSMLASALKDSMQQSDLARRFANLEKMHEIEQRDQNIRDLQEEKQQANDKISLQEARIRQQYILLVGGVIGIILLTALAFVYYRFYSRIKTLNTTITEKNKRIHGQASRLQEVNAELNRLYHEVSEQKEEIQAQANELSDSNRSISDLNRNLERLVSEKTNELRNTNDELAKHNNELLQFSYTVSHNLRGPVARLLGLSTLAHNEADIAQVRQWITLIARTANDLDLIIKDLGQVLDLRNEPHRLRQRVDLLQEWKQSISLLQESINGNEEILADFSGLPALTTVRPMIQNTFYNLLSNAIKFRSPDRQLKINAVSFIEGGKAVIEVSDNGLGFDPDLHRDKLFKLYRRFHSHVEGRGLGLYLIKSQLDLLNGHIEVESEPNAGSLFRITLPLGVEDRNMVTVQKK